MCLCRESIQRPLAFQRVAQTTRDRFNIKKIWRRFILRHVSFKQPIHTHTCNIVRRHIVHQTVKSVSYQFNKTTNPNILNVVALRNMNCTSIVWGLTFADSTTNSTSSFVCIDPVHVFNMKKSHVPLQQLFKLLMVSGFFLLSFSDIWQKDTCILPQKGAQHAEKPHKITHFHSP